LLLQQAKKQSSCARINSVVLHRVVDVGFLHGRFVLDLDP